MYYNQGSLHYTDDNLESWMKPTKNSHLCEFQLTFRTPPCSTQKNILGSDAFLPPVFSTCSNLKGCWEKICRFTQTVPNINDKEILWPNGIIKFLLRNYYYRSMVHAMLIGYSWFVTWRPWRKIYLLKCLLKRLKKIG